MILLIYYIYCTDQHRVSIAFECTMHSILHQDVTGGHSYCRRGNVRACEIPAANVDRSSWKKVAKGMGDWYQSVFPENSNSEHGISSPSTRGVITIRDHKSKRKTVNMQGIQFKKRLRTRCCMHICIDRFEFVFSHLFSST